MGKCVNHPEIDTDFLCMKHEIYMCEKCLKCRDPELYCKFRSGCMIWYMTRHMEKDVEQGSKLPPKKAIVSFSPDNKSAEVEPGETLLEAAARAGVFVNSSCNGKGVCGKCKLKVIEGAVEKSDTPLLTDTEKARGYVLACRTKVLGDVRAEVPEESVARKLRIAGTGEEATSRLHGLVEEIEPMVEHVPLELSPPTLDDPVSDLDRLKRGLKKAGYATNRLRVDLKVMRDLARTVRDDDWHVTAAIRHLDCSCEIGAIRPGNGAARSLGIAVDIGTTTIVTYLVDMADGRVLAAASGHNRQAACGDDIINRIVCAEKSGVRKLSAMALSTINSLIAEAADSVGEDFRKIDNVVLSGNTTMVHLLLRIEPRYIRREPYIPAVSDFPVLKAGGIGLKADPNAAVFVMPGPASYVGGDIVSGVMYAGLHETEQTILFIDVGTNGEIVLGCRDWMVAAACSAGPAFEGGGMRWGMRAEEGAMEKIRIDRNSFEPEFKTVGDFPPRGICGTGMIDLLSEMLLSGVIDQRGGFLLNPSHPRMTDVNGESAYVLAFASQTPMGENIVFTESDISNLIRSKAAVYAGFMVLLEHMGMDFSMIDRLVLTGGFGQCLDLEKAVIIGLLPDIDPERFAYLGNSSVAGAYMALLSAKYRRKAREICKAITYLDFSTSTRFMEEFTSAMFLPHTQTVDFPGVMALLRSEGESVPASVEG